MESPLRRMAPPPSGPGLVPHQVRQYREQCRADRDQDVGAQTGRLLAVFALQSNRRAQSGGEEQTPRTVNGLHALL
jgi:hypothetical protein